MTLSVVVITHNEEHNIGRLLESVNWADECIVLDSGSTDRTVEVARSLGAKVYCEPWKGYAPQKNSAIEKACGDWILALDADEAVEPELMAEIRYAIDRNPPAQGFRIPFKHFFLGRWMRHGGYYPDRKLRLFRRGQGRFGERPVHESVQVNGPVATLSHAILHYGYPSLEGYIRSMNRYSSLGAEIVLDAGRRRFSVINVFLRPLVTFLYNYVFRLGFLDGREGLLLHLYHAAYVSWKYAKAWELGKRCEDPQQEKG